VAVLSIWGPADRVPERAFPRFGAMAVQAAREVGGATVGRSREPPVVA
jgi:DNA-binding IclR family transcriptional regulator